MTIKQLKKELGLTNKDLAQFFDMILEAIIDIKNQKTIQL